MNIRITFFAVLYLAMTFPGCYSGPDAPMTIPDLDMPEALRALLPRPDEQDVRLPEVELVPQIGHERYNAGSLAHLMFSPDGQMLVTGGVDGTIGLWDVSTGMQLRTIMGGIREVEDLGISPDGRILAVNDASYRLRRFDIERGELPEPLADRLTYYVNGLDYLPDGRLVTAGEPWYEEKDSALRIWSSDMRSIEVAFEIGDYEDVENIRISPDGRLMAVVTDGSRLAVYDLATQEMLQEAYGRRSPFFTADSRSLICEVYNDGRFSIDLIDAETGQKHRTIAADFHMSPSTLSYSPSADHIAVGFIDSTLSIYQVRTGEILWKTTAATRAAFSPDGLLLACEDIRDGLQLRDARTGQHIRTLMGTKSLHEPITSIAGVGPGRYAVNNGVRTVDMNTASVIMTDIGFSPRANIPPPIVVSPDGRLQGDSRSVVAGVDSLIYDLTDDDQPFYRKRMVKRAYDPDDQIPKKTMVTIRLRATGDTLYAFEATALTRLFFSADSRLLITAAGEVVCRDAATGRILSRLPDYDFGDDRLRPEYISPDGRTLLGRDREARLQIWDVRTGKVLRTPTEDAHQFPVMSFSPDNRYIVLGTRNRTLTVQDTTGIRVFETAPYPEAITALTYDRERRHVISGTADGRLEVWDIDEQGRLQHRMDIYPNHFIIATPNRYYASSRYDLLHSVALRKGHEAWPLASFSLRLNRPDRVLQAAGETSHDFISALHQAYRQRLRYRGVTEEMPIENYDVPELTLLSTDLPDTTQSGTVSIRFRADAATPLHSLRAAVNGVPIPDKRQTVIPDGRQTFTATLSIDLIPGSNNIELSALNTAGVSSKPATIEIFCDRPVRKPDLYLLSIGISDYAETDYRLRTASRSAEQLADSLAAHADMFDEVHVMKLLESQASGAEIRTAFETIIRRAAPHDHVLVYFNGHAIFDVQSDLYLAPYDMHFTAPETQGLLLGDLPALFDRMASRRKQLILDAVHPTVDDGLNALPNLKIDQMARLMTYQLAVMQEETGTQVIAAVGDEEYLIDPAPEGVKVLELLIDALTLGMTLIKEAVSDEPSARQLRRRSALSHAVINALITEAAGTDINNDGRIDMGELRHALLHEKGLVTRERYQPAFREENRPYDFAVTTAPVP